MMPFFDATIRPSSETMIPKMPGVEVAAPTSLISTETEMARLTASSNFLSSAEKTYLAVKFSGATFSIVLSTTRLMVWVTLTGASANNVVVIIPVAMEVTKAQRLAENAARGKEFQAKELAARGLKENTANFKVQDKATGKIVGTRPDAVTKTKIVEMKDKKYITSTQQLRAQAQLGQQQNKQNVLITTAKKISESVRKLFKIEPSKSKSSKSSKKGKK